MCWIVPGWFGLQSKLFVTAGIQPWCSRAGKNWWPSLLYSTLLAIFTITHTRGERDWEGKLNWPDFRSGSCKVYCHKSPRPPIYSNLWSCELDNTCTNPVTLNMFGHRRTEVHGLKYSRMKVWQRSSENMLLFFKCTVQV